MSGVRDGSRVLEVGTGSGELFRKLVQHNPSGVTVGIDYSHQMAARTGRTAREMFPSANSFCHTASACSLPLADSSFDFVFSCLMLELLDRRQQVQAFEEFQRVLKPGGRLTIVLIGEDSKVFNWLFVWCVRVAPAFWGAQIEHRLRDILRRTDFRIIETRRVRQNGYPALVMTLEA
jgi:ubiquinone/menaquinone biosynthesis C-methylase UbiE